MAGTPGANSLHGGGTLEVGTVGFLGEPTALGLALAFGAANRLGAIDLVVGIAPVGEENGIAVQALTRAGPWRHSGAKKIQAPRQPNSVDDPGAARSEEDGGRTKKRFGEAFRRKPTKKIPRFSDRPFHTVFIPASADKGMDLDAEAIGQFGHQTQELLPVLIRSENVPPLVPSCRGMMPGPGAKNPPRSRHDPISISTRPNCQQFRCDPIDPIGGFPSPRIRLVLPGWIL